MGEVNSYSRGSRFSENVVLSKRIEPYGIVRVRAASVPEDRFGPQGGVWCYADAFLEWRRKDPSARVSIVPSQYTLFRVTFKNGSSENLDPLNIFFVPLSETEPYRVHKGGYILDEIGRLFLNDLLAAEAGKLPQHLTNGDFLRYPRNKQLSESGLVSDEPQVGQEVVVIGLSNWEGEHSYRIFTPDEKYFPFEIVQDPLSHARWENLLPRRYGPKPAAPKPKPK